MVGPEVPGNASAQLAAYASHHGALLLLGIGSSVLLLPARVRALATGTLAVRRIRPRRRRHDRLRRGRAGQTGVPELRRDAASARQRAASDRVEALLSSASACRKRLAMPAGSADAAFVAEHDELDAVAGIELCEQPRDVCLHGCLAEEELGGDFGVGVSYGDEFPYLPFACS